jgi:hypothetical protein
VCQALGEIMDETLTASGFRRARNSVIYSRRIGEAVQKIDVAIQHRPKDHPNAAAAIYPILDVRMDSVNALVTEMVCGDPALGGRTDITLREPIEWTSVKAARARWFLYQPDSVPGVIAEMKVFLLKWTLPILDQYTTPAQMCDAYDRDDERVSGIAGVSQWLRVVAAMVLCGRWADAMAVMEHHFGRLGPRRQYECVFKYLEARNR